MLPKDADAGRRGLLTSIGGMVALASTGILIPEGVAARERSSAVDDLWPGPNDVRQIWLKRRETGEEAVVRYYDGKSINMRDYHRACKIMRDVKANTVANIDIELFDLMFVIQKWLVSWGIDKPLIINSGFRTAATNGKIEGAAKESMHLKGKAADIMMPGIPADYLGRLAAVFQKGGVGFYASNTFVHIDTGSVRYWNHGRNRKISR